MIGLERLSLAGLREDVTVTVIGGGATGVELAGSLADLRNIALAASYPEIDNERVHAALIEQAPALLMPLPRWSTCPGAT
jgi:NADH:ubiquinone reductase (H+-translocating)